MTNFKVVEGNDLIGLVNDFVELYNGGSSVDEITRKLNISRGKYATLRKHCSEDGLIELRNVGRRKKLKKSYNPLFYCNPTKGGYRYYPIYSKGEYVCNCKSLDEANFIIGELEKRGYDERLDLKRVREDVKLIRVEFFKQH